ncbi:MAG TPA: hypothetical protein VF150_08460 [Thermoanaerobaculia bacterium]
MKNLIALTAVLALVLAAGLPAAAFAGDKDKGNKDKTDTISGCLGEGEAAGQFILTKDETGDEVRVTGSGDLGEHVGHEVALTGHWEGEQSEGRGKSMGKHFVVTEIQHISAQCEVG